MKHAVRMLICIILFVIPVSAVEYTAPEIPQFAKENMPDDLDSFPDALVGMIRKSIAVLRPDLQDSARLCCSVICMVLVISVLNTFDTHIKTAGLLAGTLGISAMLLQSTGAMIRLAETTVIRLRDYGNLLLPVMAGALAAQGRVTSSTGMYLGTAVFDAVLGTLLSTVFVPAVYLYLAFAIAAAACSDNGLTQLCSMIKGSISWFLKTILTVFTTYMSITGVISGTTDAAALKATKLTISTMVPVIGGILSDASESVLIGAGIMKNAAGMYGIIAVLALFLEPFLRIGIHYLVLKITNLICGVFGEKQISALIGDYSSAMGMLLAVTGAMCLLLLISTVCCMKGTVL